MLRPYGDLDILCHEEDWSAAHEALLGLGYRVLQPLTAPPPKVARHKAYYHTQYFRDDTGMMIEIHYDLWWYGLRPALGEIIWQRTRPLTIAGASTRMVSPEDLVLHLSVHLHHHGYARLIWFTDLALLLHDATGPTIDWTYVVTAARREGVGLFLYYSLYYLQRLLGVGPPAGIMAALRPNPLQAWIHDRLWPPREVLSVEMSDRAVCDFHEVPDATELTLNFLLTGRRIEKLIYLGRLLVPSTEWLAYYYGTSDPATLRRRRLTHAPKLLATALGQLGGMARNGLARRPL
jgi:hypothetical protein